MTADTGPTRRGLALLAALAPAAGAHAQEAPAPGARRNPADVANGGVLGLIAGGIDGTYIRIASDLAAELDDGDRLRLLPILGKGSLQNIADLMYLRGVDMAIVQSDVLAFALRQRLYPNIAQRIHYIAKLYDEEIHLLATGDVTEIGQLEGRTVNVDVRGSGTAMTASVLLDLLGVGARLAHAPQDVALEQLRRGEIAAMIYVAGKPARLFSGLETGAGLRFLPLPATPAMLQTYQRARLSAADYPRLIGGGEAVETLSLGAVLAVYAWPAGSERHARLVRFGQSLLAHAGALRRPPRHPKWREFDMAAALPGWTRFAVPER
ncbi:TAXI family TRAP transporter solute-binding subunit [Teichococcus aestuarii]|uniref:TAXI family TRAP transporter solute-binding subunit n=1 Tax=Teichococcus aestuarii TaxID=568898 RepID=UPI0036128FF2